MKYTLVLLSLILVGMGAMAQTRGWDSVKVSRDERQVIAHFNSYDPKWDSVTKAKWRYVDSIIMKQYDEDFDRYFSWDMFYMKDARFGPTWVSKELIPYRTL